MRWGLEPFKNLSLMVLQEFLSRKFEGKFCGSHGFHRRCHHSAKGRLISAFGAVVPAVAKRGCNRSISNGLTAARILRFARYGVPALAEKNVVWIEHKDRRG